MRPTPSNPMSQSLHKSTLTMKNGLENTLAEIASEKAGIIKPGIPVVSAPQRPDAEQVIRTRAAECKAPLQFVTEHYDRSPIGLRGDHQKTERRSRELPRFVWPRSTSTTKQLRADLSASIGPLVFTNGMSAQSSMALITQPPYAYLPRRGAKFWRSESDADPRSSLR